MAPEEQVTSSQGVELAYEVNTGLLQGSPMNSIHRIILRDRVLLLLREGTVQELE